MLIDSKNACAVATHGDILALVNIYQLGAHGAQAVVTWSLKNLAAVQELRTTIVEDRAIIIIINLMSSITHVTQENVVAILQNLFISNYMVRWEIVNEGAI